MAKYSQGRTAQELVARQRGGLGAVALVGARDLGVEIVDLGRQQALEPERQALLAGERGALVDQHQAQQRDAVDRHLHARLAVGSGDDVEVR